MMMMNTEKHNQNNNKRKSDLISIIFGNQNSPTQQEDKESDHGALICLSVDCGWELVLGSIAFPVLGSKQLLLLLLKPQRRSRRWGKDIDIFTTDGSRHIANWTEALEETKQWDGTPLESISLQQAKWWGNFNLQRGFQRRMEHFLVLSCATRRRRRPENSLRCDAENESTDTHRWFSISSLALSTNKLGVNFDY